MLRAAGEAGARATRILLAERDLETLGMYRRPLANPDDGRAHSVEHVAGFDVLASDEDDEPEAVAAQALEAGVSCVLQSEMRRNRDRAQELGAAFASEGLTLVVGASPGVGIAHALAAYEMSRLDDALDVTVAWTITGRRLRKGEGLPFPEPIGPLWGSEIDEEAVPNAPPIRKLAAPVDDGWSGAMARVTGIFEDGVARRVVGVADHARHLEGLALSAAALTLAAGGYNPGLQWPAAADAFLERALAAGLSVATFTERESTRDRR